ncbi:MAG: ComF family protein [Chloroflexota bacterium]
MRVLLDLLLPPHCPGCGREGVVLCEACRQPLYRRLSEPPGAPIGLPCMMPEGLSQLEWCATFSGPVRDAIHALKYRGERRLAQPLADALAARWAQAGSGADTVTWVPVHHSRRRERGFDQAQELAQAMAGLLGLPTCGFLERHQRTEAQHALGQAERADNIAGAFRVPAAARHAVAGRWILLVDDVMTTGSTMAGCASALTVAGAVAVSAITVARDR